MNRLGKIRVVTSGHPLKRLLRKRRLSQSRLARLLDLNESLLSHYLSGRRMPPEDFYPRVAELLEERIEDIVPDDGAGAASLAA